MALAVAVAYTGSVAMIDGGITMHRRRVPTTVTAWHVARGLLLDAALWLLLPAVASTHARCAWQIRHRIASSQESPPNIRHRTLQEDRRKDGQMNIHHAGTTGEATTATNRSQPMIPLIDTLASDVTSSPARRRHAPGVGHIVGAVAVVVAGLLLGALAGVLIGLAANILLAGPDATLLVLGGACEGALAGVVIGSWAAIRAS